MNGGKMRFRNYFKKDYYSKILAVFMIIIPGLGLSIILKSVIPLLCFGLLMIGIILVVITCTLRNIQDRLESLVLQKWRKK